MVFPEQGPVLICVTAASDHQACCAHELVTVYQTGQLEKQAHVSDPSFAQ